MLWKQISNDMQVQICVSPTSTKSGPSGTSFAMLISQPEKV